MLTSGRVHVARIMRGLSVRQAGGRLPKVKLPSLPKAKGLGKLGKLPGLPKAPKAAKVTLESKNKVRAKRPRLVRGRKGGKR